MTDSEKLDLLLKQMGAMDERFTQLDNRLMKLENGVTDIRLTLENEKEMLIIRVNTLENEMRRMKDKINSFA